MIRTDMFAVQPAQITLLDDKGLVELLRQLLLAEARETGLPLAGVHVPAQITIPDGGEDGRMVWEGGLDRTNYLPRRHTALQAKATVVTRASLKAETHTTTATSRRRKLKTAPVLRSVLSDAIAADGAYIVVTSKALTTRQKKPLISAIRDGIAATGHEPDTLAIDIYDANKLANWASHHQAVALALHEKLGDHALSGFKSLELWSRREDFHSISWVDDDHPRFALAPAVLPDSERRDKARNTWTFAQARRAVLDHLAEPRRAVRVSGASGLGKSRFAHSLFRVDRDVTSEIQAASVIYADYAVVGDAAVQLAHRYADAGLDVVLVVDECPDRVHQRLIEAVSQDGSRLRLISIDVENQQMASTTLLTIEVGAGSSQLIETIVGTVDADLDPTAGSFVRDVAQGFPRMAINGARAAGEGGNPIRSAEELIERIVWGRRAPDLEAMRALEVASLFDVLRIKGQAPSDLAHIAPALAEMSESRMREHLLSFSNRGVVAVKGRFAQVQPIPLAAHLGRRRLMVLGATGVSTFFAKAPDNLKSRLLDRLKWLDTSDEARAFATELLSEHAIGSRSNLDTEFGARCFDRLVHVVPDLAMDVLDRELRSLSIEELKGFEEGRRYIVWALEKLVFRHQTFDRAARLLLRLAAAETESNIGNNATGEFTRLFQLQLSGTEADPDARLAVLDEGLASDDPVTRQICVEASGMMLDTGHFSRSGGAETIGSQTPLKDWQPRIWRDIWDFHQAGLDRLSTIAVGSTSSAETAQNLIGTHIRGLLSVLPFEQLEPHLLRVTNHVRVWREAIQSVSSWLYFDRRKCGDAALIDRVRALYDTLMPDDLVDQALLFTAGWSLDIHDPDCDYDENDASNNDQEYSDRMVQTLAKRIAAAEDDQVQLCLVAGVQQTLHSGNLLGKTLAQSVLSPQDTFRKFIELADRHGRLTDDRFLRGFLNGVDERDSGLARICVDQALSSPVLCEHATGLMQGLSLSPSDIPQLVDLLQRGLIKPDFCAHLAYGRGFADVDDQSLAPFLDALIDSGPEGCWSALEIVSMVLHGTPDLAAEFASRIKTILTTEGLFEAATRRTRDAHLIKSALDRLAAHDAIDGVLARSFTRQLLRIADLDTVLRFDFVHYLDDMFAHLIAVAPDSVWGEIAGRLQVATEIERWRLERLFERDRDERSGAGVLFKLPESIYLDWARQAPDNRAAVIAEWLPLLDTDSSGNRIWHPALQEFLSEFAGAENVLQTIGARLRPSGWWGSLVPHLEPWLPLLDQWRQHELPVVRNWARTTHQKLLDQIQAEREDDAEREVSIW